MNTPRHPSVLLAVACAAAIGGLAPAWGADIRIINAPPGHGAPAAPVRTANAPAPKAAPHAADAWMDKLQAHMNNMKEIASRYERSIDPVERQKLWAQQQKEMWAGMQVLYDRAGAMTQGCADGMVKTVVVAPGGSAARADSAAADARMERLEQRLDAMQTMMNRLIDGQEVEDPGMDTGVEQQ